MAVKCQAERANDARSDLGNGSSMGMGKRADSLQQEFRVATESLACAPLHVLYDRLNGLLAEAGFDRFVESSCEAYYNEAGRPSIPQGTYIRMLLMGYF